MEALLQQILQPNTNTIRHASEQLNAALKDSKCVEELYRILITPTLSVGIRQYAGVALRNCLKNMGTWNSFTDQEKKAVRHALLNAFLNEQIREVRRVMGAVISVIITHEAKMDRTVYVNEVLCATSQWMNSKIRCQIVMGAHLFNILAQNTCEELTSHVPELNKLFKSALEAADERRCLNDDAVGYVISGMSAMLPYCKSQWLHEYNDCFPLVLKAIYHIAMTNDENKLKTAFNILDETIEYTPHIINKNMEMLFQLCVGIAKQKQLCNKIRATSVYFLISMTEEIKGILLQSDVLDQLVEFLFELLNTEEDVDEDEENAVEAAARVLDEFGSCLPKEVFLPKVLRLLSIAANSNHPGQLHAAYMCLGAIAESCSEEICEKYIDDMVKFVVSGVTHLHPTVRNRAITTLGIFASDLQPEIARYAKELFPLFSRFIREICNGVMNKTKPITNLDRFFNTLCTYVLAVDSSITPYVCELMERCFELLDPSSSRDLRNHGLKLISAIADVAEENFSAYYEKTLFLINPYLNDKTDTEMRANAVAAFGTIGHAVEGKVLRPNADVILALANDILNEPDQDTRMNVAALNLLGALSKVMEDEMEKIFPLIIRTIKTILTKDTQNDTKMELDEVDSNTNLAFAEEEESEEKEEALNVIKDFATYSGGAFMKYVDELFPIICNLSVKATHPQTRISAILALFATVRQGFYECGKSRALQLFDKILFQWGEIFENEEDCIVISETLHEMVELIDDCLHECKLKPNQHSRIFGIAIGIICEKVQCTAEDTRDLQNMLLSGYNLFSKLGSIIKPDEFYKYFDTAFTVMSQTLMKYKDKLGKGKYRARIYCTLGDCFPSLGTVIQKDFNKIFQFIIAGLKDPYFKARAYAAYALGQLVNAVGTFAYEYFPIIFDALSEAVAVEDNALAFDNFVAAKARIIISSPQLVVPSVVLPSMFVHLPLKEDFMENEAILTCFYSLLQSRDVETLKPFVLDFIRVVAHVLVKKQFVNGKTAKKKDLIKNALRFLQNLNRQYSMEYQSAKNTNPNLAALAAKYKN